jgi:hypothetical protein
MALIAALFVAPVGVVAANFGLHAWKIHIFDPVAMHPGWGGPMAPSVYEGVLTGVCSGLLVAFLGGMFLAMAVETWPPARRPLCAAILCASIGGTIVLIHSAFSISWTAPSWRRDLGPAAIVLGCVMLTGAAFGFLTALMAQWLKRRVDGSSANAD